jgi:antitoxin VapB
MAKKRVARLFRNGRSQAVRLPREFRFEGDWVRIRRVAAGILLQPLISETPEWFAELDRFHIQPFMKKGRKQPRAPRRKFFE